jgi:DNA mismatch repair protein MutS
VKNLNVAVSDEGGKIVFLHKLVEGGADRSYGIHVAQLAGLPSAVIHRAEDILKNLEGEDKQTRKTENVETSQLSFLPTESPIIAKLKELDVNSLTPLEALTILFEIKKTLN